MNENTLTQIMFRTLERIEPPARARFMAEVVGLADGFAGSATVRTQTQWVNAGQQRGVVIAIAPVPGLSAGDGRYTAGSVVDAAVFGDGTAALFELKTTGPAGHAQLVRHANHWALDVPSGGSEAARAELNDGFALRTWDHVRGWLGRELDRLDPTELDHRYVTELADAVQSCGLGAPDRALPAAPAATPVAVDHPAPVPTREMTANVDLKALARECARLYGKNGSQRVGANDCRQDARRITDAYEEAERALPTDLSGNPMTPRRVLTALYSGEAIRDAAPASWTDLRQRLLTRGADRSVLLALLAWAQANEGTTASKHLSRAIPRLWNQTLERLPGLDELHQAVSASRVAGE